MSKPPSAAKPAARRRKAPAPSPGLTREAVVAAALAQIDEEGLEAFSLRNLAKRLSVYPTAIYWHVPNRNQLLAEAVALALGGMPSEAEGAGWRDYLRNLFGAYRDAFRAHPNIAPLVGSQLVSNTNVDLAFLERLLAELSRAGFAGVGLVGAYNTIIAALVGFTTQEFAPMPPEDTAQWREEMRARLDDIDAQTYPVLAANMGLLANRAFILRWDSGVGAPLDESFALYVETLIRGLDAMLETRAKPARRKPGS
jgi:TetR/AcrR family transcriptional regulator, tetracycline repressor protein